MYLLNHYNLQKKNLDLQYEYDNLKADYISDKNQRAEIERLHENTRRLKHDMKNHIMVAVSYLNNGDTMQAKDYLSAVLDNLNKSYSYIQTGNSVMNYIINSKPPLAEALNFDTQQD